MEQFSHDLTLALEETSRCGRRWGMRRRTRSTGNLREFFLCPFKTSHSSELSFRFQRVPRYPLRIAAAVKLITFHTTTTMLPPITTICKGPCVGLAAIPFKVIQMTDRRLHLRRNWEILRCREISSRIRWMRTSVQQGMSELMFSLWIVMLVSATKASVLIKVGLY